MDGGEVPGGPVLVVLAELDSAPIHIDQPLHDRLPHRSEDSLPGASFEIGTRGLSIRFQLLEVLPVISGVTACKAAPDGAEQYLGVVTPAWPAEVHFAARPVAEIVEEFLEPGHELLATVDPFDLLERGLIFERGRHVGVSTCNVGEITQPLIDLGGDLVVESFPECVELVLGIRIQPFEYGSRDTTGQDQRHRLASNRPGQRPESDFLERRSRLSCLRRLPNDPVRQLLAFRLDGVTHVFGVRRPEDERTNETGDQRRRGCRHGRERAANDATHGSHLVQPSVPWNRLLVSFEESFERFRRGFAYRGQDTKRHSAYSLVAE